MVALHCPSFAVLRALSLLARAMRWPLMRTFRKSSHIELKEIADIATNQYFSRRSAPRTTD